MNAPGAAEDDGLARGTSARPGDPASAGDMLEAVTGLALLALFVVLGLLAACMILELLHPGTF